MANIGKRAIHYLHKLSAANIPIDLIEKGQNRVIDASLTLIRERAKLKVYTDFAEYTLFYDFRHVPYLLIENHVNQPPSKFEAL